MPSISLLATIVATIVSFVLGALWYGPVFANSWMAGNGFTREELQKDFNPGMTYGATFVLALASAFVLGLHPASVLSAIGLFALLFYVGLIWMLPVR